MSVSVAQLQALKRQTGARPSVLTEPSRARARTHHGPENISQLRQLLRVRLPSLTVLPQSEDHALPGKEIAS